jgi:hypothetical protein
MFTPGDCAAVPPTLSFGGGLRMSKPTISTAPPSLCYNTYQSRVMRGKFIISIPPIHNTLPKRR